MKSRQARCLGLFCAACVLLFATSGIAKNREPVDVVYATGYANSHLLTEPGFSETLISRERLAAYGSASLTDVLSDISGLFVDQNAGRGSFNSLFLRGADPNFTQIRINGIVVNDATNTRGGAFDIGGLSALAIERVEIINDASSALYGSQALAGVINIVTRQANSGMEAVVGLDSHGGYASSVLLANQNISLAITSERPESDFAGSLYESDQVDLNGSWSFFEKHQFRFNARYQNSELQGFPDDSGGELFAVNRDLDQQDNKVGLLGLHYLYALNSGGKIELNTSVFSQDQQRITPAIAPGIRDDFGFPEIRSATDYRRISADVRYLGADKGEWSLLAGLHWEQEQGDQAGELDFSFFALPSDFSLKRDTVGVSALVQRRIGDRLSLRFGGRLERIDGDTVANPRVSADYAITANQRVYGSWGEGFKSASFYALGEPLIGNSMLNDERSRSFDVGHQFDNGRWQVRHVVFASKFTDLIDFDNGPPPSLVNRSKVETRGIESFIRFSINDRWNVEMNQVYVSTKSPTSLRQRPRYRFNLSVNYKSSDRLSLWARVRHTSERLDSSIPTSDQFLASNRVVNIGGQWKPSSRWAVTANVQNALQEEYQTSVGNLRDSATILVQLRYVSNPLR